MVMTSQEEFRYFTVHDGDLDMLLRNEGVVGARQSDFIAPTLLAAGETGVLAAVNGRAKHNAQPLALICHDEDLQRLYGRYAHVRAELSPLSAWCHVLSPEFHRALDGLTHRPKFDSTLAAWSGLVVAEALLLSARPLSSVRISACLASATYAVGRAQALWSGVDVNTILERFDLANRLCRGWATTSTRQDRLSQVRLSFAPLWKCLFALNGRQKEYEEEQLRPLIIALDALRSARSIGDPSEASFLAKPIFELAPEVSLFDRLMEMTPERRLVLFDQLINKFREIDPRATDRRNALALATGYLATVAAGGSASLALLEDCADEYPELTGWAYLVAGIGEEVTWSSGFDGLGRLIAREFQRPLRLDDPPTCDFAFDEAAVLADKDLKDPLVHLKIKQAKILSVSLFPGVNISIPVSDSESAEIRDRNVEELDELVERERRDEKREGVLAILAEALWPYLLPLVVDETTSRFTEKRRKKSGPRRAKQTGKSSDVSQLPLADRKR